jgi:lysophospholipase L1-like esterase
MTENRSITAPYKGMQRMVAAILLFTFAIACKAADLVTTTPVTQDRNHAAYSWQNRHEEILQRNKQNKPDVVFFGDSIIHFWGGEPKAPSAWAAQSWSNCFAGISVENLGFGWDRTENVLWRIEHGELDDIQPKVIIIKIGTNNININTPEDIATGLEAVCRAAHERQPGAEILLLGVLPRADDQESLLKTGPLNKLLDARFVDKKYVTFRDFQAHFRNPDGAVNGLLYMDGIHINAKGYDILGALIRAEVTRLLK